MSSGPSIVLNTPTVLLDKDFDPFEQMVPNYGDWEQGSSLPDQIFATIHEDEDKDENKTSLVTETGSFSQVYQGYAYLDLACDSFKTRPEFACFDCPFGLAMYDWCHVDWARVLNRVIKKKQKKTKNKNKNN